MRQRRMNRILDASSTSDQLSNRRYAIEAILAENLDRLAAVLRKAQQGESYHWVIGGSITQGSSTSNTKYSYSYMFISGVAFPNGKSIVNGASEQPTPT